MILELTLDYALNLVPHLSERDRREILRTDPDLWAWALDRVKAGMAWCYVKDGAVQGMGGVVTHPANTGDFWVCGREGWTRYARHALRLFQMIKRHGGYSTLSCNCYVDNPVAQAFAERLGFTRLYVEGDLVYYTMKLGG